MTTPAAPAAGRPAPARRRPGEFGAGRKFTPRRKVCAFCVDKIKEVDYKDLARLRRFLSERGKIEPRRKTGTCAAHQRSLNVALKRARQLAMLPFTAEHIRVTGVVIREPGAPPFRGPRLPRLDATETAAAETPEAAAVATENGVTAEGPAPSASADTPQTATESEPAPTEAPPAQAADDTAEPDSTAA
jgi:small subunit ribosomal protein S18